MFKLGLEKTEEPELKLPKNCGQFLKRWNTISFYLSCEKPVLRSRSNRTGHEAMVWFKFGSKLGKTYAKDVYCHPNYLTYMQSTFYEMLGWLNLKMESRFAKEISKTSDMLMIPL